MKTNYLMTRLASSVCFMVAATAGAEPESKPAKPKTVADDMPGRRIFPNAEEAAAYLTNQGETLSDFGKMTLAAPGVDSEGTFDPAIYTDEMDVMVSKLNKQKGGVKAIVIAPIPKLHVLLGMTAEDYAATPADRRAWIEKILHKEMSHVSVRHLRDAEDVSTVIDQMPTTITGYLESGRDSGGGIMAAFDDLYKQVNGTLAAKLPIWAKARLIKSDLRKAMESAGYAREFFAALEDYKGQSLFVAAIKLGIGAAKRKGLDPTIFERWMESRNAKEYKPGETDDDELDLDDIDGLTDALLANDAEAEAPAADAEAETTDAGGDTDETVTDDSTDAAQTA